MGIPYTPKINLKSSSCQIKWANRAEETKKLSTVIIFMLALCHSYAMIRMKLLTSRIPMPFDFPVLSIIFGMAGMPIGMAEWVQRAKSASNKTSILSHLSCHAQTQQKIEHRCLLLLQKMVHCFLSNLNNVCHKTRTKKRREHTNFACRQCLKLHPYRLQLAKPQPTWLGFAVTLGRDQRRTQWVQSDNLLLFLGLSLSGELI